MPGSFVQVLEHRTELRAPGVGLRRITELLAETAAVVRRHWRGRIGVLFLSPSSNRNASMIAWSRLDALRFIRSSRSRYSSPDGNFSLAHVKYSRFTSTGSEPGTDFAKSTGGAGTVGGFVGGGANLKPGASLSTGIPVNALESNTKRTMCSREFGSTLWACVDVSSVAPTVAAAVTAAAPVSTVRRVNAPPGSSSNASGAIEPC